MDKGRIEEFSDGLLLVAVALDVGTKHGKS